MKKLISTLLIFCCVITLSITAYAAGPRRISGSPSLSFSGTTATCNLSVISAGSTIDCTLTLYEGDTIIQSWSGSNTGYLLLSGSTTVQHGHTYTLSGSGSVNGSPITISPVTRTCPQCHEALRHSPNGSIAHTVAGKRGQKYSKAQSSLISRCIALNVNKRFPLTL